MSDDSQTPTSGGEELQHLKRVSRVKHIILEKYFPPWAMILGSRNRELAYVDCFAGPGQYEMDGKPVLDINLKYWAGHPVIEKIERVSRPGLRIYKASNKLPNVMNGLGVAIVWNLFLVHQPEV